MLRRLFTDDLVLQRCDNRTPGSGLPQNQQQRLAGTHSGTVALLRKAAAGDRFYQPRTYVLLYVAAEKFNDLRNTPLKKGQLTTHGLLLFLPDSSCSFTPLEIPNKFARTGRTDAYDRARGEVIELQNQTNDRELDIETEPRNVAGCSSARRLSSTRVTVYLPPERLWSSIASPMINRDCPQHR